MIITDKISNLPEEEGVYFLFADKCLLYIGRSSNIKRRVKKHSQPSYSHEMYVNPIEIRKIGYVLIENHEECKLTEQNLIIELQPKHNGGENWFCNKGIKEITQRDVDKMNAVEL